LTAVGGSPTALTVATFGSAVPRPRACACLSWPCVPRPSTPRRGSWTRGPRVTSLARPEPGGGPPWSGSPSPSSSPALWC